MIFIHSMFKQYLLLVCSNNHHGSNKIVEITADTYGGLPECSWLEIVGSEREVVPALLEFFNWRERQTLNK